MRATRAGWNARTANERIDASTLIGILYGSRRRDHRRCLVILEQIECWAGHSPSVSRLRPENSHDWRCRCRTCRRAVKGGFGGTCPNGTAHEPAKHSRTSRSAWASSIANGLVSDDNGGGIHNTGGLTLTDCAINNNASAARADAPSSPSNTTFPRLSATASSAHPSGREQLGHRGVAGPEPRLTLDGVRKLKHAPVLPVGADHLKADGQP